LNQEVAGGDVGIETEDLKNGVEQNKWYQYIKFKIDKCEQKIWGYASIKGTAGNGFSGNGFGGSGLLATTSSLYEDPVSVSSSS